MIALISSLFAAALGFAAINDTTPTNKFYTYTSVGLERIKVSNLKGNITIIPMDMLNVRVSANKVKFPEACSFNVDKSSDLEEINVSITGPSGDECQADLELRVPTDVALDVSTKAGDINISGMENTVTFFVAAGSLKVDAGKLKRIEGKSGAGQIDIKNFLGTGKIEMGAGSIEIAYSTATPIGKIEVQSGTGIVNLRFPKGAKLKSDLQTGIGLSQNEFSNDTSATAYGVSVKTGAGNINVKTF